MYRKKNLKHAVWDKYKIAHHYGPPPYFKIYVVTAFVYKKKSTIYLIVVSLQGWYQAVKKYKPPGIAKEIDLKIKYLWCSLDPALPHLYRSASHCCCQWSCARVTHNTRITGHWCLPDLATPIQVPLVLPGRCSSQTICILVTWGGGTLRCVGTLRWFRAP